MIRVIVADDHPVVRKGLVSILATARFISLVGQAENAAETQRLLQDVGCDVLLLDVSLPDRSGIDLLPELLRQHKRLAIILLSQFSEDQLGVRAMQAGAAGYLTKESAADLIVSAVTTVARGKIYVTPTLAELMTNTLRTGRGNLAAALSTREIEVLRNIASGHGMSDIAHKMGLSVKTVSTYRTRILEKIGGSNNVAIMSYARANGLEEELCKAAATA